MGIKLPEILNLPPKLLPIILRVNDFRYFLLDGGRSSAKSQSVARFILWLCEHKNIRVVCGREIQNTVEESVYAIFKDLITKHSLNFTVLSSRIDHNISGSTIRFRGLREQGSVNIQGLEGVDVLWVDEAQSITKNTLDVIIPTIRKQNSKIFWTMNRHVENDPVFVEFSTRKDCLHIHSDYRDNTFCPQKMIDEAQACKNKSEADYKHIWLGEPLAQSEDYIFSMSALKRAVDVEFHNQGTSRRIMAVDIARFGDDKTIFTVLESHDVLRWKQIFMEAKQGWDTMQTCGRILDLKREFRPGQVVIDDTGVGGGVTDRLNELRNPVLPFNGGEKARKETYFNKRSEGFFILQDFFKKDYIKILNDVELIEQLLTLRFKYKSDGTKAVISKDELRKDGIKSPDKADALMMAIYFSDRAFRQETNRVYGQGSRESVTEYSVLEY